MNLFGSPMKIWGSVTKIWGLNLKLGVSIEKFGLSNEMVVMVGFYKAKTAQYPLILGFKGVYVLEFPNWTSVINIGDKL